jgi:Predicted transcriptional regulators
MTDENGEKTQGGTESEKFGANIANLRVRKGFTQASLAQRLGVTHQAVSQWECGDTMPDIAVLPKLASMLGVTLDSLFGIESDTKQEKPVEPMIDDVPQDDGKLRAVVFIGSKMVKSQLINQYNLTMQHVVFEYRGPALNVESQMALQCGDVAGNASAGHSLTCENVTGNATGGHSLSCGNIGQNANAGHSLTAKGSIGGSARAGHGLSCGDVNGDVNAGHSVNVSGSVGGKVTSRH